MITFRKYEKKDTKVTASSSTMEATQASPVM